MSKCVAIGRMRPAMDLEYQRIFFGRIEAGRLLNPPLNLLAIESRVPEFLGVGQVELREQLVVDPSKLRHVSRSRIQQVQVADIGRGRDRHRYSGSVR